jgi:hypothetical protein
MNISFPGMAIISIVEKSVEAQLSRILRNSSILQDIACNILTGVTGTTLWRETVGA